MPVEKFDILLECLSPNSHAIIYPECMGSWIQGTDKANKPLSVISVCSHGSHNGAMA